MKYLDEYRNAERAEALISRIKATSTRMRTVMEVCGGQTHSLLRYRIPAALDDSIELIHGPGCPVCVTPISVVDAAVTLSQRPNVQIASFGDMLRVPGTRGSLAQARTRGGNVRMVYSPIDAVELAAESPDTQVVFLAVGFETTAPATALALLQAHRRKLRNFSMLVAHVRVLPAMEAIMQMPGCRVEGFLAAGHVCTVTGFQDYHPFARKHRVAVVVTGFEPVDLLEGILALTECLELERSMVINRYGRSVRAGGNPDARALIERVYQIEDAPWRGFGIIPAGGLRLRPEFRGYDALCRFGDLQASRSHHEERCRGAEVMSGQMKPPECPEFGVTCTPESPLGAPMVSSEGACAAYHRFQPLQIALPAATSRGTDEDTGNNGSN